KSRRALENYPEFPLARKTSSKPEDLPPNTVRPFIKGALERQTPRSSPACEIAARSCWGKPIPRLSPTEIRRQRGIRETWSTRLAAVSAVRRRRSLQEWFLSRSARKRVDRFCARPRFAASPDSK